VADAADFSAAFAVAGLDAAVCPAASVPASNEMNNMFAKPRMHFLSRSEILEKSWEAIFQDTSNEDT
jgi:hypothetical protein